MGIDSYFLAPGANTALFPEGMSPSAVNDGMRKVQADIRDWYTDPIWIQYGKGDGPYTAAFATGTSFTIAGANVTAAYHANRRVKITGPLTGTRFGRITGSTFSNPNTIVTVALDSGALQSEALRVWLSAIPATGSPLPGIAGTLGSVASFNVGTSGETVPLLNAANTWAESQIFEAPARFRNAGITYALFATALGRLQLADATVGLDPWIGMIECRVDTTPRRVSALSELRAENGFFIGGAEVEGFASEAQARAGSNQSTIMSPLRVQNAIATYDIAIGNRTERTELEPTDELHVGVPGPKHMRRASLATLQNLISPPDEGAVGSYAYAARVNATTDLAFGDVVAGSDLFPAGMVGNIDAAGENEGSKNAILISEASLGLGTTWRCMGFSPRTNNLSNVNHSATLWRRIS